MSPKRTRSKAYDVDLLPDRLDRNDNVKRGYNMKTQVSGPIIVLAIMLLPFYAAPTLAQNDTAERAEMIKIQNSLRLFRDFEHDSRHLYFLMTTAIISFEGGWMARDSASGLSYAENLREVAKNQYLPQTNRLLMRIETNKNLDEIGRARMTESAEQMLSLISLSKTIADALDDGRGSEVNRLFQEAAFPVFKSIWAANYTLISNAERRFPSR